MAKRKDATKARTRYEQVRETGLTFVGQNGQHITGVPARNLEPNECSKFSAKTIDRMIESGLYTIGGTK